MTTTEAIKKTRDLAPPGEGGEAANLDEHYAFKAHPLLPLPSEAQMARDMAQPETARELVAFLNQRAALLRAAEADPLYHRLRLPQSRLVDELLCRYQMVYESGGKRAGKTEDGVPRFLECCLAYGKAKRWAMQDNALSSVANLQQTFWHYLPKSIQALNNKRTHKYRVHYSPQNGFDGLLILPEGCEVYFLNYTQNPGDFLGWELGKHPGMNLKPGIPDIGALLDENCPLGWLENIQMRCSTRGAKIHWMYSPQEGITPAIKDLKANAKTRESAPAELLSERVNVPGLPRGQMPVVQVDETKRLAIFYRFTEHNPFSGYNNAGGVKELCRGKNNAAYTMAHAYGYCEAVKGRAFPLFGEWNVIPARSLPAEGTNYLVTDPGGARNWFTLWARVAPGNPMEVYIYREWPDHKSLEEWALTSKNPKRLNGERGPAQPTIGYGPAQYKKLFLGLERIVIPGGLASAEMRHTKSDPEIEALLETVPDPQHRAIIRRALGEEEDLTDLREVIYERLADPRAGAQRNASEKSCMTVLSKLQMRSGPTTTNEAEDAPAMPEFRAAPGLEIRQGLNAINELLYFDANRERVPLLNAPRWFVSEECRNLIWAMNNYSLPDDTDGGMDDACEDPVDDCRYLATRGLRYVQPGGKVMTKGGGSY